MNNTNTESLRSTNWRGFESCKGALAGLSTGETSRRIVHYDRVSLLRLVILIACVFVGGVAPRDSPADDTHLLIQLLDSADGRQRTNALKSLADAGPEAAEALPQLLEILEQEDSYDKTLALRCLAAIGPAAAEAVPQLHSLLKDKDKALVFRMEALGALGRIGPASEVVIPTLIDLLKNPGELEKSYPKASGSPSAMGLMAPMLHKGDDGRWYFDRRDESVLLAIGGLGSFGAAAAHALPELQRVRDDPDMLFVVHESAEKAIGSIQAEVARQQKALERSPSEPSSESIEPS